LALTKAHELQSKNRFTGTEVAQTWATADARVRPDLASLDATRAPKAMAGTRSWRGFRWRLVGAASDGGLWAREGGGGGEIRKTLVGGGGSAPFS